MRRSVKRIGSPTFCRALVTLITAFLVSGCEKTVISPGGPVDAAERIILLDSMAIMLAIVVPTILATLGFAWWFRSTNKLARRLPDWSYSGRIELIVWSIPALVVMFLGGIAWIGSHDLDPAKPLQSDQKPLEIDVVSLDWKWLFIYPEQRVASLNQVVVPRGIPLHFRLTSATVMNVFFVPRLGSQIYTMNGMVTQLYLQADEAGIYPGFSAHFSGDGFSDMTFDLNAVAQTDFESWVSHAKASGSTLDEATYRQLLQQSSKVPVSTFRDIDSGLFDRVVNQALPPGSGPPATISPSSTGKPLSEGKQPCRNTLKGDAAC